MAQARLSLRRKKTCGDDGVIPEMALATGVADWLWAVAFNRRIMNMSEDPGGAIADEVWDRFRIRLLAKVEAPTFFKLLRPIAVLKASVKLWSRCCYGEFEKYDVLPNTAHLGFKKTYACAELVQVVRMLLLLSKRAEWGLQTPNPPSPSRLRTCI